MSPLPPIYTHGPTEYAKTTKARFRVGDPDLPERRNSYASSLDEEGKDAPQVDPCGKAKESRTHCVGGREMDKEERDALEEMRKVGGCDMEEFNTPDNGERTIAILGDRWRPQTAKQQGGKMIKMFYAMHGKKRNERPKVGGVSSRSSNGGPVSKGMRGQWSND